MADDFLTLTDLAKINSRDIADIEVSDLFDDSPVIKRLAADIASNGVTHKYVKETQAPVVGFRDINDGRENDTSEDTEVSITLKLLDASFRCDVALAGSYRLGAQAYLAREAKRHMKAAFFAAEKVLFYGTGTGGLTGGFTGLAQASTLDALADTGTVVNATGSTATTGSSVYLIRSGGDLSDCTLITGNDGNIEMMETVVQSFPGSTGHFAAYYTPIMAYLGLQLGSAYSVVRICNLTEDSGKGLTDALIGSALSLFPASRQPTFMAMSRRSHKQLRASRTATNPTGAPAPFPSEAYGVPIVVTDALINTEAIVT